MVFEQIVDPKWLQKRPLFALVIGFIYTLIGSVTSFIFFRENISISMLFFITLLLVPSLASLLSAQEQIERREGIRHFFRNHKDIFEIYLFLSLGVLIGYLLIISSFSLFGLETGSILSEQVKVFGEALTEYKIESFTESGLAHALGIFSSNLGVALIFFILSIFYGAGAIFLIVWITSIFSTFITLTIQNISKGINHSFTLLGIFSLYIIPEIAGFLLAAIAGGLVSKAVITENFRSLAFKNVIRDATILLLLSFALLLFAAILESFVAVNLFKLLIV